MLLTFADVIRADEQQAILAHVGAAEFVAGRETAGAQLAQRKHNEQIRRDDTPRIEAISTIVLDALKRNETFCNAVYPKQLHSLLVSRYRPGMHYGAHVDQALMGGATAWRTDLSLTLFLNAAEDYDGGELSIEAGSARYAVKLGARSMVCYATGQMHQVLPVTRGERLAVVAWIQSFVRDHGAREALADLARAREALRGGGNLGEAYELVNKTHMNLLRRWAEP